MDKVFCEDVLYRLDTALNRSFIVGSAMLSEQVFQDIAGYDGVALDGGGKIFSNDKSSKMLIDLFI